MTAAMRTALFVLLGVMVASAIYIPLNTRALLPFGGSIFDIQECDGNLRLIKLGPPTPGYYIWSRGSRSYLYGEPKFPSQWLLGNAGPPAVCEDDDHFVAAGPLIIFHGSSSI